MAPPKPLRTLDASNAHTTVRFSDRSKFGFARIWLPDPAVHDPLARGGWSVVVRLHGGNGNNQGDLDPDVSPLLLMMLNELGSVVVSINWQDNGFYEPNGQDPRALFFPDGLLEPSQIVPWLLAHWSDSALFGAGGFITRDLNRVAFFGASDGGWRAALLAYSPSFVSQPNVLIASQGHFDIEHFWMTEPSDAIDGWRLVADTPAGATQLEVAGGTGAWLVGHELVLKLGGQTAFEYLVTGVAGDRLTIWPALRAAAPALTDVSPWDNGVSKYSKGGYSWLGAPMFRSGGPNTWANFSPQIKRAASLWPLITASNPRVPSVRAILLYPPQEPYVTNDSNPVSGWNALLSGVGPNPRYKHLHAEGNAYALSGLLTSLGYTQGGRVQNQFLMRAGGPRTNPIATTRYDHPQFPLIDAVKQFLSNHGW